MMKFYGVYQKDCFYIIISNEVPKIGKTYIGWRPSWLSSSYEFDAGLLLYNNKKLIPWNYFIEYYYNNSKKNIVKLKIKDNIFREDQTWLSDTKEIVTWLNENIRLPSQDIINKSLKISENNNIIQVSYIKYESYD